MGKVLNSVKDDLPAYTNDEGFTPDNSLKDRVDEISEKFKATGGHSHTGAAGDGGPISVNTVDGTEGAPEAVVAGTGITFTSTSDLTVKFVQGSGGAVDISANPQIAAGSVGQRLVIIGKSDTNTVLLEHGDGLSLNGQALLDDESVIELIYTGSLWLEMSRNF